jgi:hypothetical protein
LAMDLEPVVAFLAMDFQAVDIFAADFLAVELAPVDFAAVFFLGDAFFFIAAICAPPSIGSCLPVKKSR